MLTAAEDGTDRLPDPDLLDRASGLGRVLVSMDADLVVEAVRRQREGIDFRGIVFARQRLPIKLLVEELEVIAGASEADELRGVLMYLPLR